MNLLKEFKGMDKWVKVLFVVSVIVLLWALVWPRSGTDTSIVPIHIPGIDSDLYAAQFEHMDNKPSFVMFYAPWCGYCKKAMPEWDSLSHPGVDIMKINCDEDKETAKLHGVKSYPTIKLLPNGLSDPLKSMEYNGERTVDQMKKFLSRNL